ncbi:hypothetical protein L1987_78490 [Smallanthus sonchifolius]|uniref:Uncharacterized protein n=1 Tax=Smallanthus sonchifolius TaxID=185202 RepID=A0ACB8ZDV6_9ASTR|nr:hypothetical protein L1987_78490 [Smallanthus sonchifolius]
MSGYETDDTNSECEESENKSNDGVDDLLDDAFQTGNDADDENVWDNANFSDPRNNPNVEKLFVDMEKPLYPGCDEFSILGFLLELMNVKRDRNDDQLSRNFALDIFKVNGHGIGKKETQILPSDLMKKALWFIFNNCQEVQTYLRYVDIYVDDDGYLRRSEQEGSVQPRIQSTVDGSAPEIIPHPTRKRNRQLGNTKATPSEFATECGIVMRNVCPLNIHKWDSIPDDVKDQMYEKLQVKFNLLRTDRRLEYVNERLRIQWKRTRGNLSEYWKNNGGKINPQLARSQMKPNCRSQEDWNHICDY